MRVSARRRKGYAHSLTAGRHTLIADEPPDKGGTDTGATPGQLLALSLASCTAITIEMYADRKGWDVGGVEVEVEYGEEAEVKRARKYDVLIKLPADLSDDQVEKLREIAHKCPVHRTLKGHVEIDDRIERMSE
jgi:putative redox protein